MHRNIYVIVTLTLSIACVRSEVDLKDGPTKPTLTSYNSISTTEKPGSLDFQQINQASYFGHRFQPRQNQYFNYQQQQQQLQPVQYQYQELPRRQIQLPQHQKPIPVAMVIIAQPAIVPASALQPHNMQQLLQYFRGNSLARYQLLHGNYAQTQPQYSFQPVPTKQIPHYTKYPFQQSQEAQPIQQAQPTQQIQTEATQHQESPVQTRALYDNSEQQPILPQPLIGQPPIANSISQPQYQQPTQTDQQEKPFQLSEISQIAQQAAQHFLMSGGVSNAVEGSKGYRTAPAIITGLENFSPEHQEKIKAQLSAHFGAPLQPFKVRGQKGMLPSTRYYPNHRPTYDDNNSSNERETSRSSEETKS
ncbi:uncharacterized protein LOC132705031 isoform X2 [Cylas formicarius]|uniref:uncharacterized protein LOC132705031 isoform X2 n=1 Tax=Cylas formicarius TaxID=197179 RepID=UPI002958666A|nr:uncharacterized protein LOC132705031 isoform X2 [Cylas formicarius]